MQSCKSCLTIRIREALQRALDELNASYARKLVKLEHRIKYARGHKQFKAERAHAAVKEVTRKQQTEVKAQIDLQKEMKHIQGAAQQAQEAYRNTSVEQLIETLKQNYFDKKQLSLTEGIEAQTLRQYIFYRGLQEGKKELLLAHPFLFDPSWGQPRLLPEIHIPEELKHSKVQTKHGKSGKSRAEKLDDKMQEIKKKYDEWREALKNEGGNSSRVKELEAEVRKLTDDAVKDFEQRRLKHLGGPHKDTTAYDYYKEVFKSIYKALNKEGFGKLSLFPKDYFDFLTKYCDADDKTLADVAASIYKNKDDPARSLKVEALEYLISSRVKDALASNQTDEAVRLLDLYQAKGMKAPELDRLVKYAKENDSKGIDFFVGELQNEDPDRAWLADSIVRSQASLYRKNGYHLEAAKLYEHLKDLEPDSSHTVSRCWWDHDGQVYAPLTNMGYGFLRGFVKSCVKKLEPSPEKEALKTVILAVDALQVALPSMTTWPVQFITTSLREDFSLAAFHTKASIREVLDHLKSPKESLSAAMTLGSLALTVVNPFAKKYLSKTSEYAFIRWLRYGMKKADGVVSPLLASLSIYDMIKKNIGAASLPLNLVTVTHSAVDFFSFMAARRQVDPGSANETPVYLHESLSHNIKAAATVGGTALFMSGISAGPMGAIVTGAVLLYQAYNTFSSSSREGAVAKALDKALSHIRYQEGERTKLEKRRTEKLERREWLEEQEYQDQNDKIDQAIKRSLESLKKNVEEGFKTLKYDITLDSKAKEVGKVANVARICLFKYGVVHAFAEGNYREVIRLTEMQVPKDSMRTMDEDYQIPIDHVRALIIYRLAAIANHDVMDFEREYNTCVMHMFKAAPSDEDKKAVEALKSKLAELVEDAFHRLLQQAYQSPYESVIKACLKSIQSEYLYCDDWYELLNPRSEEGNAFLFQAALRAYDIRHHDKECKDICQAFLKRINFKKFKFSRHRGHAKSLSMLSEFDETIYRNIFDAEMSKKFLRNEVVVKHLCDLIYLQRKYAEAKSTALKLDDTVKGKYYVLAAATYHASNGTNIREPLDLLLKENDKTFEYWVLFYRIISSCYGSYLDLSETTGNEAPLVRISVLCAIAAQRVMSFSALNETLSKEVRDNLERAKNNLRGYFKEKSPTKSPNEIDQQCDTLIQDGFRSLRGDRAMDLPREIASLVADLSFPFADNGEIKRGIPVRDDTLDTERCVEVTQGDKKSVRMHVFALTESNELQLTSSKDVAIEAPVDILEITSKEGKKLRFRMGWLEGPIEVVATEEVPTPLETAAEAYGKVRAKEKEGQEAQSPPNIDEVNKQYLEGLNWLTRGDKTGAVFHFEKVIEKEPNHAGARFELGRLYLARDQVVAARHLECAKKPGHQEAEAELMALRRVAGLKHGWNLLEHLEKETLVLSDWHCLRKCYEKAIEQDKESAEAHYKLALLFGKGVLPHAPQTSVSDHLKKAADCGHKQAKKKLAEIDRQILERGAELLDFSSIQKLLDLDHPAFTAKEWNDLGEEYKLKSADNNFLYARACFERADPEKNKEASYNLWRLYRFGLEVSQDPTKARSYLQKAAHLGLSVAAEWLKIEDACEAGPLPTTEEAWCALSQKAKTVVGYERAIEINPKSAEALYGLAWAFHHGTDGVAQDVKKALDYYMRAISHGKRVDLNIFDASELFDLATKFKQGQNGIAQDTVRRRKCFLQACKRLTVRTMNLHSPKRSCQTFAKLGWIQRKLAFIVVR